MSVPFRLPGKRRKIRIYAGDAEAEVGGGEVDIETL